MYYPVKINNFLKMDVGHRQTLAHINHSVTSSISLDRSLHHGAPQLPQWSIMNRVLTVG